MLDLRCGIFVVAPFNSLNLSDVLCAADVDNPNRVRKVVGDFAYQSPILLGTYRNLSRNKNDIYKKLNTTLDDNFYFHSRSCCIDVIYRCDSILAMTGDKRRSVATKAGDTERR
jgi:hypothetical protein